MGHIDLLAWNEDRITQEIRRAEKEFKNGGLILGSAGGLSMETAEDKLSLLYPQWKFKRAASMKTHRVLFAPSFREVFEEEGKSVLDTARQAGIYIPSDCNGKGQCGRCRIRLIEGNGGPFTPRRIRFYQRLLTGHWVTDWLAGPKSWVRPPFGSPEITSWIQGRQRRNSLKG